MFTGIVEEIGQIRRIISRGLSSELVIDAKNVLEGTKPGDSIAVNGVCLTVTSLFRDGFSADVMPETLRCTNLGKLFTGSQVNLERAMAANGRFGGHIVTGHIDGIGTIRSRHRDGNAVWLVIQTDSRLLNLIILKGSITVDGVSLTVAKLTEQTFSVSLIPHTGIHTALMSKQAGAQVNLENDMIGKYIEKFTRLR